MDIDVVRHVLAVHLGPEHRVLEDQVVGDDLGPENVTAVIDVAQEHIERLDALLQSLFELRPFLARQDPGITSNGSAVRWTGLAIDREGDADAPEQQFGFLTAILQRVRRGLLQPEGEFVVGGAGRRPARSFHRRQLT
jgi:hypothetical protein